MYIEVDAWENKISLPCAYKATFCREIIVIPD